MWYSQKIIQSILTLPTTSVISFLNHCNKLQCTGSKCSLLKWNTGVQFHIYCKCAWILYCLCVFETVTFDYSVFSFREVLSTFYTVTVNESLVVVISFQNTDCTLADHQNNRAVYRALCTHCAYRIIYHWYYLTTFAPRSKYISLYVYKKIVYTKC